MTLYGNGLMVHSWECDICVVVVITGNMTWRMLLALAASVQTQNTCTTCYHLITSHTCHCTMPPARHHGVWYHPSNHIYVFISSIIGKHMINIQYNKHNKYQNNQLQSISGVQIGKHDTYPTYRHSRRGVLFKLSQILYYSSH